MVKIINNFNVTYRFSNIFNMQLERVNESNSLRKFALLSVMITSVNCGIRMDTKYFVIRVQVISQNSTRRKFKLSLS